MITSFLLNFRIGCTVQHFLKSKPFNHPNLVTTLQYPANGMSTRNGIGFGSQSGDKLAQQECQMVAASHSTDTNQDRRPSANTLGWQKVALDLTDHRLPKIKTEMHISDESAEITSHKGKRVRAAVAAAKPMLKRLDANSSRTGPTTRQRAMKAAKTGACATPQQPMVQRRKRKNTNTTITGNPKKKQKLSNSTVVVDTERPFKCHFCDYSTISNRSLSRHMRVHKDQMVETSFKCDICSIQFTQQGNLNAHMKKHGDMFAYQCSVCRMGFNQKKQWQLHESSCTAKQYECHLCDKKFHQRKSDLVRHIRIWHTGERPFICTECPQKYHLKNDLVRHMQFHQKKSKLNGIR